MFPDLMACDLDLGFWPIFENFSTASIVHELSTFVGYLSVDTNVFLPYDRVALGLIYFILKLKPS